MEGPAGPWGASTLCTPRSETVVERMLSNWMSICLYQYLKVGPQEGCAGRSATPRVPPAVPAAPLLPTQPPVLLQDSAGEPLYKLFKAIKHQVEKGPVDAVQKKAKYTLNDTGLLGDDVEYAPLVSRQGQGVWTPPCCKQEPRGPGQLSPWPGGGGFLASTETTALPGSASMWHILCAGHVPGGRGTLCLGGPWLVV